MTRRARDKRARDISTIDSAKLNVAPPPFPRFNEASNPLSAPLSMEQKPPSFQNRGGYFQSEPLPFSPPSLLSFLERARVQRVISKEL